MNWPMVALGDLTESIAKSDPRQSQSSVFTYIDLSAVDNIQKRITAATSVATTDAPSRARQIVKAGDVLVSTVRPNLNAVASVPTKLDGATASTGFSVLRPNARLDKRYLSHWVQSETFISKMVNQATGASYPAISDRLIKRSAIPLPPLDEQRRVAAILDQAGDLRSHLVRSQQLLDSLPQALFRERFGDPLTNSLQLPTSPLSRMTNIRTGNSPSRSEQSNFGDSIEWIKSDNLGNSIATIAKEWLSQTGRAKARIAPPGTILVTCIAGSRSSIGKASLVDREVAFNQQINAILPSDDIDSRFLLWQLKSAPELVRQKSTGGMKGLVNKTEFSSVSILCPPKDAQHRFAQHVAEIEDLQFRLRRRAELADTLHSSLQTRAFRGEL